MNTKLNPTLQVSSISYHHINCLLDRQDHVSVQDAAFDPHQQVPNQTALKTRYI